MSNSARPAVLAFVLGSLFATTACGERGGSSSAGGGPVEPHRSDDPAVAGPAVHARLAAAVAAKDADALWATFSKGSHAFMVREIEPQLERARQDPEAAARLKEMLGLPKDGPIPDAVTFARARSRRMLESAKAREEFAEEFGDRVEASERTDEGLVVRVHLAPGGALKRQRAETRLLFVREEGAWVFDLAAQRRFDAGILRSLDVPGGSSAEDLAVLPDGKTLLVVTSADTFLVPTDGPAKGIGVKGAVRVVMDPKGAWFALENPNAEDGLALYTLPGGARLRRLEAERSHGFAASRDGASLLALFAGNASVGRAGVWIYPIAGGEPAPLPLPETVRVASAEFTPDGTRVVFEEYDGGLRIHARDGKRLLSIPRAGTTGPKGISVHPEGRLVAGCDDEGRPVLHDLVTGDEVRRLGTGTDLSWPKFSPDGTQVACRGSSSLWRYDTATGRLRGEHRALRGIEAFDWSPDGRELVATGRDDAGRHVIVAMRADR